MVPAKAFSNVRALAAGKQDAATMKKLFAIEGLQDTTCRDMLTVPTL